VATFPGPLLKGLAGVREMPPFFQTADAARKPVDAGQYL
jgi:LemA protein